MSRRRSKRRFRGGVDLKSGGTLVIDQTRR
jgi:Ribonuclease G/E